MCVNVTKIGKGYPKLLWCNASIKPTKLPNMETNSNEPMLVTAAEIERTFAKLQKGYYIIIIIVYYSLITP